MSKPQTESSPRHAGLGFAPFVLMIASLQAMGAMGVDAMLPNLPAISHAFGLTSQNQRQLVIGVYLMGFGAPQILYGALSDRFGRRPVLLGGIALYVACSIIAAFSPSFPLLIAARTCQGLGAAVTRSLPSSIVRDCYVGRRMAQVMSLSFMTFMAVPMLAPTIGQGIALFASWRWVFGFLSIFGASVFAWVAFKLPETLHAEDRTPIRIGPMAHNFGIAVRSREGMGYAFALMFVFGALFGFVNAVELVFQEVFHQLTLFPAVFAVMAGCMSVASLINSRLVGKLGMRRMSHTGVLAFIALSVVHTLVAVSGHESLIVFVVLQGGVNFAFGFMSGNFGAMAMEKMGHVAGAAASLQGTISMVGASVIGFFIGQQFDGTIRPMAISYAVCGLLALVCVLWAENGKLFRKTHLPLVGAAPPVEAH
jgi:DHA1 family bicyclomycin/chloramphenicol resistance-like MFS transporter